MFVACVLAAVVAAGGIAGGLVGVRIPHTEFKLHLAGYFFVGGFVFGGLAGVAALPHPATGLPPVDPIMVIASLVGAMTSGFGLGMLFSFARPSRA